VVKIGTGAVFWSSKLQTLVALSTTEAEHISAVEARKEILWLCEFMGELGYNILGPSLLWMDNQSAIAVSKNLEHKPSCFHTTMSFTNLFAALASPGPAPSPYPFLAAFAAGSSSLGSNCPSTPVAPTVESAFLAGSKHPHSFTQLPLPPWVPQPPLRL
jgi:hypothetical protein